MIKKTSAQILRLVSIANRLDQKGATKEADQIDLIIQKWAGRPHDSEDFDIEEITDFQRGPEDFELPSIPGEEENDQEMIQKMNYHLEGIRGILDDPNTHPSKLRLICMGLQEVLEMIDPAAGPLSLPSKDKLPACGMGTIQNIEDSLSDPFMEPPPWDAILPILSSLDDLDK